MKLKYDFRLEFDRFEYYCGCFNSNLFFRTKDIVRIYKTFEQIHSLRKQAIKYGNASITSRGLNIKFDPSGYFRIEGFSNWLDIEEEVPIIIKNIKKYISEYDEESIKDIITKIKQIKV